MLRRASYPPSVDGIANWLASHETEWISGRAYRFAAVSGDRIIGCADIGEIARGSGDLGYWFDEEYWGRGFAAEAAALIVDLAVKSLRLRLTAGHIVENVASGRILARFGFRWKCDVLIDFPLRHEEVLYRRYELDPRE
jgi:[ribosomal protein S5]-alanine N-acetyltransferase